MKAQASRIRQRLRLPATRRRPPRLPRRPAAARLAVAWGLAALLASCGGGTIEPLAVGNRAPDFTLESLAGEMFESASLEGRPVVLNFWATWCAPCRTEIPELIELSKTADVTVVGIALDEEGARLVRPFAESFEITYPVLLGDEEIFLLYDGFVVPHTVVLDSSLTVHKVYRGPVTREILQDDLATISGGS